MNPHPPYLVRKSGTPCRQVEAWSGYPLQFAGQRRFTWQDQMAAELRAGLADLQIAPSEVLAGTYVTTDAARCDPENRLFTNRALGTA